MTLRCRCVLARVLRPGVSVSLLAFWLLWCRPGHAPTRVRSGDGSEAMGWGPGYSAACLPLQHGSVHSSLGCHLKERHGAVPRVRYASDVHIHSMHRYLASVSKPVAR